ncbi:MAG TPA: tryptophan synthase subunit alpha [bacterium]|nr:tryptophan synthase subunit alpha [bacterium]HOL46747.1 tryptophan synthase subunit alpha [bacterium]HPQ18183.1 tryptophan synthase subunit alpha [bacterium]
MFKKFNYIVPYWMFCYPDFETSLKICKELSKETEIMEIGYPFSDPLADGPIIQATATYTLSHNIINFDKYFSFVKEIKNFNNEIKLYSMTYVNPIIRYGIKKFFKNAINAGLYGFIIPDLSIEEADYFLKFINYHNLKITFLVTPITEIERIKQIAKLTTGFIYFVTYTGVTGKKVIINKHIKDKIKEIKLNTKKEVYVGFGIKSKEDIVKLKDCADKVIIASEMIKRFNATGKIETIINFLQELI